MIKVFISSTTKDLKPYRVEVSALIRALGFKDISMESWAAQTPPPRPVIESGIKESDIYVGIIGHMYGSRLGDADLSYTHHEYSFAQSCGKPRLMFLRDPATCPVIESDVDRRAVEALRETIGAECSPKLFSTPMELAREISASLFELWRSKGVARYERLAQRGQNLVLLRHLANDDLLRRREQLKASRESSASIPAPKPSGKDDSARVWFFPPLKRCNVGESFYVSRQRLRADFTDWAVNSRSPYLILTGPSGVGKTNFVVDMIQCLGQERMPLALQAVLPLSLGAYEPSKSFINNLTRILPSADKAQAPLSGDVMSLIMQGRVLVFLDGLDEFAKNHSTQSCSELIREINGFVDPGRSKLVLTCRGHIYRRLKNAGVFGRFSEYRHVPIPDFTEEEAKEALAKRLGPENPIVRAIMSVPELRMLAQNPLLLEMMCHIDREGWKRLARNPSKGELYDLWFADIVSTVTEDGFRGDTAEELRGKISAVARWMLERRTDLIPRCELDKKGIPIGALRSPDTKPFGVFVEEGRDEWGFVHGSFREFTLARTIAAELSGIVGYDLLASSDHLDYVGAELLLFLRGLFPSVEKLVLAFESALDRNRQDQEAWDKVVWNAFETIGNVGGHAEERLIDKALEILGRDPGVQLSFRTLYNVVRCIERLHPSAPRPYCDHVMTADWAAKPSWETFGAFAIRGFQSETPRPRHLPAMWYRHDKNTSDTRRQDRVSDCLLNLLQELGPRGADDPQTHLEINCTFALIRWLDERDIERVKLLLAEAEAGRRLNPKSRGNFFQAFLRFRRPEIFADCDVLFEGMEVGYCEIRPDQVPPDFLFRKVVFNDHARCRIDGLMLENCICA